MQMANKYIVIYIYIYRPASCFHQDIDDKISTVSEERKQNLSPVKEIKNEGEREVELFRNKKRHIKHNIKEIIDRGE